MPLLVPRPFDPEWQQVSSVQLVWLISNKTFTEVYPQSSLLSLGLTCHWAEEEKEKKNKKTDVFNVQASSCRLPLLQLWQSEVENWSSCDTPQLHGTTAEQHHSTTVPELHGTTAPCVDEGGEVIKTLTDIFKHDLHLELLCYTLEEVRQVLFRPEAQRDVCNVNKYLTRSCRDLFQICFF